MPYRSNQDEERTMGGGDGGGVVEIEGGVEVGLKGVALAPDTRKHARRELSRGVERGVLAAKVEEIVREVVRGVRTPVREEEVKYSNIFENVMP